MFYSIAFLILTLLAAITLVSLIVFLVIFLIAQIRKTIHPKQTKRVIGITIVFCAIILVNVFLVLVSQWSATTPSILDEDGNIVKNSIAELREIELNGRKEWISIRGWNKENPVLLFLAGGPGGSQMAAVRFELAELEKHFIVVNWDQPGSGKSYFATDTEKITKETYIEDGHALTQYLKERFDEEKIYLIGESWGSALGIFLIAQYPEDYHAFIGTGQMVNFKETEIIDYNKAIEIATEKGETELIKQLEVNGKPPYYGSDVTWKSALYLNYLSAWMAHHPSIHNPGYNTFRDVFASEYGLLDKINFFRGVINTFNHVYQQLYDIDLRVDYPTLDVPVYFFEGRYDINAPTELVEDYYEILTAPDKDLIWFEHSGHSPWINEPEKFITEVLSCFLED
ncbi:MAG TPA: alpha/beta hydrolase [Acholeplasma sp.]